MSLEAALQENTAVMRELIARMTTFSSTSEVASPKPATAAAAIAIAKERAAAAKAQTAPAVAAETVTAATAEPTLDYEKDVRPLLVKVSTSKGRDALIALLGQFGATKGDQIAPAQFAEVVAAANDLLAA